MKRYGLLRGMFLVMLLTLAAGCGSAVEPTPSATLLPTPVTTTQSEGVESSAPAELSTLLPEDYPDALSVRNQLALGSLRLEGTADAIIAEQAPDLKLYWQALLALSSSSTSATEETAAVQTQILETMTPAQIDAIRAMKLTNTDLNAFYLEKGVVLMTPEPGVTPQSGKNSGLTQEEREATRTAAGTAGTPVGTGGGSGAERQEILLNAVIELLSQQAGE